MESPIELPLISVIMPSYNSGGTIVKSISSVIAQSYENWELIIVDDCSSDDTLINVRTFDDPRIKVIKLNANSGSPAYPRNIGIDNSDGDFISFLDSDDLWDENKLDVQLNSMLNNNVLFSCSGYTILKDGKLIASFTPPPQVNYKQLLLNNSIGCLTAMVSKDLVGDTRFPLCGHEDFAFWLKLLKKTNYVLGIQFNLAKYNLVEGSVSSSKSKLVPFFWNIYRNEEGLSRSVSLYCCARYLINVVLFKYEKI